jgi:general secretion pathway protein H
LLRRRRDIGLTLIEIMVVVAIVGMMLGGAVYGFRAVAKTELRGSASKLAGAIRYSFDRSITTGAYYRLVLDLDHNKYWVERSDERMYLTREKEESPGSGKAFDWEAEQKKRDEQEAKERERQASVGGLAAALEPPPKPRRAKFQTFKDAALPQVTLKGVRLFDVYTARQREPYTSGRAYLYFFPDGHTERAMLRLNQADDFYSLVVHPLTGRVEVQSGKSELPRDFDTRQEAPR